MKIIWVCNIMLPAVAAAMNRESSNKEGWLTGLSESLLKEPDVELAVCFPTNPGEQTVSGTAAAGDKELTYFSFEEDSNCPEVYQESAYRDLKRIFEEYKPDVIHVFGTEYPHTLAAVRACGENAKKKMIVSIQGVMYVYAGVYYADLPEKVLRRKTFRDLLRRDSIPAGKKRYEARSLFEKEAIAGVGHVMGRTDFDRKACAELNPDAEYHYCNETLRSNFYEGKWDVQKCEPHRILVSQGDYPIKGLHYALEAMPAILKKYPDARLCVAGNPIVRPRTFMGQLKVSSYGKYIQDLIRKHGLTDRVEFLGRLNATQMKQAYLDSQLFLCPSVIENSPNSMGEAMLLGVPAVCMNVGGISSLFRDGRDGFLYEKPEQLAETVCRMWADPVRQQNISDAAYEHGHILYDADANLRDLLKAYRSLVQA